MLLFSLFVFKITYVIYNEFCFCCSILFKYIHAFCRFYSYASKSKDNLVSLGFPSFTIEDFHDTVSDQICLRFFCMSVFYMALFPTC